MKEICTLILQRLTPPLFAALFFQLKLDSQSCWDVAQTDEHFNLFIWQLIRMKDIFETDWSEWFFFVEDMIKRNSEIFFN